MKFAMADLQPVLRKVSRWTDWRKHLLLAAIDDGIITEDQARKFHNISADELNHWRELVAENKSLKVIKDKP